MWEWLAQNKQWFFSGAGLTVLAIIWWSLKKLHGSKPDQRPVTENIVSQAPTITVSPTINVSQRSEAAASPKQEPPITNPVPARRANLKVEATKIGKVYLQEDLWTLTPSEWAPSARYRGFFVDIANVPSESGNIKAAKLKAVLTMQERSYSPLPWLGEFTNAARLEPAARKSVLVAVGSDDALGSWNFVLNHRENHNSLANPSKMDWTNMAPIPSDLPMEIRLVDVDSGELLAKFEYLWTFDATLNWPILKTPRSPAFS